MTEPPPQRYRVIERKGRLEVVDTWQDGKAPEQPLMLTRTAAPHDRSQIGEWRDNLRDRLVGLACLGAVDGQGRPVFTTPPFDNKGPRDIALSADGARRLGNVLIAMLVATLAVVMACVADLWLLAPTAFLATMLIAAITTNAGPPITRWLDKLGEEIPR